MAASVLPSYCRSSSHKSIADSTKRLDEPKSAQFPERARNSRRNSSRPSNKPNSLALTRSSSALADSGSSMDAALQLFEKMNRSDAFIWNVIIRGLARNEGQQVHARLIKVGLDSDVYACDFLVEMYFSVGCVELAEKVFEEMPQRDLVSWNSMVAGYLTAGDGFSSLGWFREMVGSGYKPDSFGVIGALGSCSHGKLLEIWEGNSLPRSLQKCKSIHGYAIRKLLLPQVVLETSLVDAYGKCGGAVRSAERRFSLISEKNLVSWNNVLAAYVHNEKHQEALELFQNHVVEEESTALNRMQSQSLASFLPTQW
ncbi:unnamed protein product [Linum tenue]|uniref:Pentatricopeptide repeat-containing protein n=1 Tax=Linum tenue TaxID=586396 RepID=A0AAV0JG02_9ROSI|nr:unnamed protein product [Linum tenue]